MEKRKKKILAFGEIIWDVYPDKKVIGGAPLNFAAHAVRCGTECSLVSAVGPDAAGGDALRELEHFGIGTEYIRKSEKMTGQCLVTLTDGGVPQYRVLRDTAYDHITLPDGMLSEISAGGFDALYFGTLASRSPVSRAALRVIADRIPFPETVCDVNLRADCYDADSVLFCLSHATVLKMSIEEEPLMRQFGDYSPAGESPAEIARAVSAAFPGIAVVIVTCGADGAFALDCRSGEEFRVPAVGEQVVSTVGAGDSFTAAWISAFLAGERIGTCMERAARVSGFVVSRLEAVPEYDPELL